MRESRKFAERSKALDSNEVKRKYYLVFEGEKTEEIYFNAIIDSRRKIGINPLIELRPLLRSYSEMGWSNPKKILNRVISYTEEASSNVITYETLINRVLEYLSKADLIKNDNDSLRLLWQKLTWFFDREYDKSPSDWVEDLDAACKDVIHCLKPQGQYKKIFTELSEIVRDEEFSYEEGFDKICLIVDRDKDSFVSKPENDQFMYVLLKCEEKKYGFYVTNPCFEFWLLLHFHQVLEMDRALLLDNPKETAKKRYVEKQLKRVWGKYEKNQYDAHELVKRLPVAMRNEKLFSEDIFLLKDNLGSNIGTLFAELMGFSK